jgi:5-methylcytosine-specific restriction endonuclease McrA
MTAGHREAVRQRAGGRCEYCHLPDSAMAPEDFHVEHIIARKHGGQDGMENLAWACIFCNLYKGPNLASFDPDTGELTRLFNPRRDRWDEHFRLHGPRIVGLTPVGRTSIWLLEMNSEILSSLRASLMREGRW